MTLEKRIYLVHSLQFGSLVFNVFDEETKLSIDESENEVLFFLLQTLRACGYNVP